MLFTYDDNNYHISEFIFIRDLLELISHHQWLYPIQYSCINNKINNNIIIILYEMYTFFC